MVSKLLIEYYIRQLGIALKHFGTATSTDDLISYIHSISSKWISGKSSVISPSQSESNKAINLAFFCLHKTGFINNAGLLWSFANQDARVLTKFSDKDINLIIKKANPKDEHEDFLEIFLSNKNVLEIHPQSTRPITTRGSFWLSPSPSHNDDLLGTLSSGIPSLGSPSIDEGGYSGHGSINIEPDGKTIKNKDSLELGYAYELDLSEFGFYEEALEQSKSVKRFVNCRLIEKESRKRVKRLEKNCSFKSFIYIAPNMEFNDLRADKSFDESKLSKSKSGHEIQIAFCLLSNTKENDHITNIEIRNIHLPNSGRSGIAKFEFESGNFGNELRVRVLVLHQNRILQTLLLAAPNADSDLELQQENITTPFFTSSEAEKPIDLALLINDNSAGVPGITAISNGKASFSEPEGLAVNIKEIKKLLSTTNIEIAQDEISIESPVLLKLLVQLAHQGVILRGALSKQFDLSIVQMAERIQIVEAKSKSYLPVEFVYSGLAPKKDAKICPNAKKSLQEQGNQVHHLCEYANNKDYVCPSAFWGFSKCIERHPFGISDEHTFSIPQPGNDKLNPFNAALLGVSNRVKNDDVTGPAGVYPALQGLVNSESIRLAESWDEWQDYISHNPQATLLVLLPHSENSPDFGNIPALEVQGTWLASSEFDSSYVSPNPKSGTGPIVLLIGCSTALTDIAFLNFVREFKAAGASIVIGTLATIHGKHASKFVSAFLGSLKLKNNNSRPFDEILLDVKREMLSKGDCLVLSLVAYGNSSWQIQT